MRLWNRDLIAGATLMAAGLVYAGHAAMGLPIGTLRQMGAGLFPTALGVLLAIFGLCIAAGAILRREPLPTIRPRALLTVIASILSFAFLIRTTGLIPSVIATTVLASLSQPDWRPRTVILLCLCLAILCWLIFVLLLDQPIPLVRVDL